MKRFSSLSPLSEYMRMLICWMVKALGILSGRASAIYNSFADFLFEYFKNGSYGKEDREIIWTASLIVDS